MLCIRCSRILRDSLPCHMLSADKFKKTITLKGRNAIFCSPDDLVGKTSMKRQSTREQKSQIKAHMLCVYWWRRERFVLWNTRQKETIAVQKLSQDKHTAYIPVSHDRLMRCSGLHGVIDEFLIEKVFPFKMIIITIINSTASSR